MRNFGGCAKVFSSSSSKSSHSSSSSSSSSKSSSSSASSHSSSSSSSRAGSHASLSSGQISLSSSSSSSVLSPGNATNPDNDHRVNNQDDQLLLKILLPTFLVGVPALAVFSYLGLKKYDMIPKSLVKRFAVQKAGETGMKIEMSDRKGGVVAV